MTAEGVKVIQPRAGGEMQALVRLELVLQEEGQQGLRAIDRAEPRIQRVVRLGGGPERDAVVRPTGVGVLPIEHRAAVLDDGELGRTPGARVLGFEAPRLTTKDKVG